MHAVLLDFNGTMFFDSSLHSEAWSLIYQELHPADPQPPDTGVFCGPRNAVILKNIAPWLSAREIDWYSEHKEAVYRQLCNCRPEKVKLAAGTEAFLQTLQDKGIPFTMASASIRSNIEFYFDTFALGRWFTMDKVVYDDGTYPDKSAMHLEAARRLNVDIKNCVVVEDSPSSIAHAKQAGAGCVIALGETAPEAELLRLGADHYIHDFSEFDYVWIEQ